MLIDKYRPLRGTGPGASRDNLDAKLQTVQKPERSRPPPAAKQPPIERERNYTPDGQPWFAVYSPPSFATGSEPRVYRAKYVSGSGASDAAKALQAKGIAKESLPTHDAKAMGKIRSSLKRSMARDRLDDARSRSLDYSARGRGETKSDDDEENLLMTVTGATKGLAGLADMRIEEARSKGLFKNNSLHGKPMPTDHNELNPQLRREEFFVNRMVKRQGGAPPWVELNMELAQATFALQQRIQRAFIIRALARLSEDERRHSMAPVRVRWSAISENSSKDVADYTFEAASARELATVAWALEFRDAAWVLSQRAYHEESLHQLNQIVRRYNHIAPPSARKLHYTRDNFVRVALDGARPFLVDAISARLRGLRVSAAAPESAVADAPVASLARSFRLMFSRIFGRA